MVNADLSQKVVESLDDDVDDIRDEEHIDEKIVESSQQIEKDDYILIDNNGEAFDEIRMNSFLKKIKPVIISVIGDSGCGKSSLIQSFYETFQKGVIADKRFNSSNTLIGFDRRSHYARFISGEQNATTPRTPIGVGVQYYHLCVDSNGSTKHIIIADRAGESYAQCKSKPSSVNELCELSICDMVLILIDGDRLTKKDQVAKTVFSAKQMLMSLIDNLNRSDYIINIALSKYDLIESMNDKNEIESIIFDFVEKIRNHASKKEITVKTSSISSRSINTSIPHGFGLDKLLDDWCVTKPHYQQSRTKNVFLGELRVIDKFV